MIILLRLNANKMYETMLYYDMVLLEDNVFNAKAL